MTQEGGNLRASHCALAPCIGWRCDFCGGTRGERVAAFAAQLSRDSPRLATHPPLTTPPPPTPPLHSRFTMTTTGVEYSWDLHTLCREGSEYSATQAGSARTCEYSVASASPRVTCPTRTCAPPRRTDRLPRPRPPPPCLDNTHMQSRSTCAATPRACAASTRRCSCTRREYWQATGGRRRVPRSDSGRVDRGDSGWFAHAPPARSTPFPSL